MSLLKEAVARVASLFRRKALDREFDEEAQSHLDLAADDYVRRGISDAEARRLARIKFGALEASKDAHRDSRGLPWLEGVVYDLRFSLRDLRRDRMFTLAAIVMLALAIGLNVTVFTVMDTMLFRGYPLVKRNDRLVYVQERFPSGECCISYPDFEAWRSDAPSFEGMSFVGERFVALRGGDGGLVDTLAFTVSANTFGLLGVPPMLGRDFVPADEAPGAAPVAILNYRFWESRFGKRPGAVGATVQINGAPATIIGVMPAGFDFPTQESLWIPMTGAELQRRGPTLFVAVGRLRNGASVDAARSELEAINRRLEEVSPETNRGVVPIVRAHSEMVSGPDARIIWGSLWAAAWFVWLIACANMANLTLARTIGRWRDFATRIALGAGPGRVIRQILMEGLILSAVAGTLGWWLTNWSVRHWAAATASIYQVLDYTIDSGTFAYLVAICLAGVIVFSLAPIGLVAQLGVSGALKGDARGVTRGLRGKYLASGLVASQMALVIVLLSGAGVLGRSFVKIVGGETGVRAPERILVGLLTLPSDRYSSAATRLAYFDRLDAQLKTIPGIEATSLASVLPAHSSNLRPFEIEGRLSAPDVADTVQILTVGSGYFSVVGAPAISGRDFNTGDRTTSSRVVIVNYSFAARFWPGEQPVGKRLRLLAGEWHTVVGVVPNVMQGDPLRQQFKPLIYLPVRQNPLRVAYFFVRTRVPANEVAQAVQAGVHTLDPDVSLKEVTTLTTRLGFERDYMDPEHSELGKHAGMAPVFALIALVLAAIGLYAVIAHSVSQRTKEIGVRIALGAMSQDIRRLILREGMRPVAFGLIVGLVASLAVNRILQSQLVGVSPHDPVTFATALAVMIVVALLACHMPSRQALRVDPAVVLRHD